MAGWDRVASFHHAEAHGAKLLLSRQVFSAHLQPRKDPAIIIGEIVELLAALNKAGTPVHEVFICLHFVDNLPPSYEFIKNNLQSLKEPLTHIVLEDALRNRYNVQFRRKKREDSFGYCIVRVRLESWPGSWPRWRSWWIHKAKLDSRGRSERLSSQANVTCNHCQKPGHTRPNCPESQCSQCRGWGHEAVSCPSKVPTPKENAD